MSSDKKQYCQLKFVHNITNNESFLFYHEDDIKKMLDEKINAKTKEQNEVMKIKQCVKQKDEQIELTNFDYQSYKWNSNFRDSWKNTKKKMVLLNYTYARAICVLSALSAIVATATLIVGFVNMGTYKVAEAESCVGVWCGFVMYVHIFLGMMVMASRKKANVVIYFYVGVACIGVFVYGIIVSVDYYNTFRDFVQYTKDGKCTSFTTSCICSDLTFKKGFEVENCSMFQFGEELWLAILILVSLCAFCTVIGIIMSVAGLVNAFYNKEDKDIDKRRSGSFRPPSMP